MDYTSRKTDKLSIHSNLKVDKLNLNRLYFSYNSLHLLVVTTDQNVNPTPRRREHSHIFTLP
jgi:hypothetical protein